MTEQDYPMSGDPGDTDGTIWVSVTPEEAEKNRQMQDAINAALAESTDYPQTVTLSGQEHAALRAEIERLKGSLAEHQRLLVDAQRLIGAHYRICEQKETVDAQASEAQEMRADIRVGLALNDQLRATLAAVRKAVEERKSDAQESADSYANASDDSYLYYEGRAKMAAEVLALLPEEGGNR